METIENALYVVATPIGNISDMSKRAIDILTSVDVVGAEDTRHSGKLLEMLGIRAKQLIALHDHNEQGKAEYVMDLLKSGKSMAIISDAGTPLISDPGYHVVASCRAAGFRVIPVPGACAAIAALCASGLPTDSFIFKGFLPVKEKALHDAIAALADEPSTCVFYESPRRILQTVKTVAEILGPSRRLVIGREITKAFESFYDYPAGEMAKFIEEDEHRQLGEFVLMVAGNPEPAKITSQVRNALSLLLKDLPAKKAAAALAEIFGLSKNELYDEALKLKNEQKQ